MPVDSPNVLPWSDDEIERLLRLIESGCSLAELSRALGRAETEVARQAHFLGVLVPGHKALSVQTSTADSSAASVNVHYAPFAMPGRRIVV